jgi:WD40 repeat protein
MNTNLLNIVKLITSGYGEAILADPARLKAFFSDLAKDEPKPLRIAFGRCIEAGAYAALKNAPDATERAEHKAVITQRVFDEHGIAASLCAEALDILEAALFADRKEPPRCVKCGAELGEGWKVCPYCGAAAGAQQAEAPTPASDDTLFQPQSAAPVHTAPENTAAPASAKKHTVRNVLIAVGAITVVVILAAVVIAAERQRQTELAAERQRQEQAAERERQRQEQAAAERDRQRWRPLLTISGHNRGVGSAAYSPDGRQIVSTSGDGTVKVWDAESGLLIRTLFSGHDDIVNSAAFSPDGRRIVFTRSKSIRFADGSRLRDGVTTMRVLDAGSGQLIRTLADHDGWIYSAAYSPDGRRIVSALSDKTVKVWDAESGQLIHSLSGHDGWIYSAAYSPNGRRIVSAGERRISGFSSSFEAVNVWDAESGQLIHTLSGYSGGVVLSAAYSPDGWRIVTASDDGTVKVRNTGSGGFIHTLFGHKERVNSVAYSPDGRRIVSASGDKTVKVWDAENGQLIRTLYGHNGSVNSVAYSPDGRRIVSASGDGTVKVWDAGE